MAEEDISRLATPRFVPMLVPPIDWTQPDQGGFLKLHAQIMRTKGEAAQRRALRRADLRKVYKGLNCLGQVRQFGRNVSPEWDERKRPQGIID